MPNVRRSIELPIQAGGERSATPVGYAGVKNRRGSLKKWRLEPPLDVKPSAAFLSRPHAMLFMRA